MKTFIGLVALLVCVCCTQAKADDQQTPCAQKCSIQWGTKWSACGADTQCQSYVELQFRSCVRQCEKAN